MDAPRGCQAYGRYGSKQKPAPSKYHRSHSPWLSRACNRAIISWLRRYLCGSGDFAGDFLIRFQMWLFLMKRLMVLVLTRLLVFCSIASTTFLTSLGESSRYSKSSSVVAMAF